LLKIWYVPACFAYAIISVATGSSWTTVATIGIALLGIGKIMGIPEGCVGRSNNHIFAILLF
jgi:NhaC family Na+:H+ antiporter